MCILFHHLSSVYVCLLTAGLPVLDNEMYNAVKPGLSAYRDNPEEVSLDHPHRIIMKNITGILTFSFITPDDIFIISIDGSFDDNMLGV